MMPRCFCLSALALWTGSVLSAQTATTGQKRFAIREAYSLELRGDAFNLLNQVNLANPLSEFNAGAFFGRIISATNNPRLVQFALKMLF